VSQRLPRGSGAKTGTLPWVILSPERFLAIYAAGLETHGYRNSPLEVMAYDLQAAFEKGAIFDAAQIVADKLRSTP